jgi:hypothetical protein
MSGRLNQLLMPTAAAVPTDESGWPTSYASPPYPIPRFAQPNTYQGNIPTQLPADQKSTPELQRMMGLLQPNDPASYNQLLRMIYLMKQQQT